MPEYVVEYVRESSPDRVWTRARFQDGRAARTAARRSLGKVMRESGSIIIEARLYKHTLMSTFRHRDETEESAPPLWVTHTQYRED